MRWKTQHINEICWPTLTLEEPGHRVAEWSEWPRGFISSGLHIEAWVQTPHLMEFFMISPYCLAFRDTHVSLASALPSPPGAHCPSQQRDTRSAVAHRRCAVPANFRAPQSHSRPSSASVSNFSLVFLDSKLWRAPRAPSSLPPLHSPRVRNYLESVWKREEISLYF